MKRLFTFIAYFSFYLFSFANHYESDVNSINKLKPQACEVQIWGVDYNFCHEDSFQLTFDFQISDCDISGQYLFKFLEGTESGIPIEHVFGP